jgi:formylglycine-generating enzyme required for sulfatase activity
MRAMTRVDTAVQRPIGFPPQEDFNVVDLYLDPGELVIRAASRGTLLITDSDSGSQTIKADEPFSTFLKEGSHDVTITFADSHRESQTVNVTNNSSQEIIFAYVPAEPGSISITAKTNGMFSVKETKDPPAPIKAGETISRKLVGGTYTLTIQYANAYIETQKTVLPPEGTASVSFVYQIPSTAGFEFIEGGAFTMGSPASESGRRDDEVQHSVTVNSFYIGKYEVTQEEYASVIGSNPSKFQGEGFPVESVNWFEAVQYCNARSAREGFTPAYTINGRNVTWNKIAAGYRLPTEAEWEFACRAGSTAASSAGKANFNGTQTMKTGSFDPNAWGLYDMMGNVWEWCWDWYAEYESGAQTNPSGPERGEGGRVVRGGGYYNAGDRLRSARRGFDPATRRVDNLGLRLVRSLAGAR